VISGVFHFDKARLSYVRLIPIAVSRTLIQPDARIWQEANRTIALPLRLEYPIGIREGYFDESRLASASDGNNKTIVDQGDSWFFMNLKRKNEK
jgi:hypothetical protein